MTVSLVSDSSAGIPMTFFTKPYVANENARTRAMIGGLP